MMSFYKANYKVLVEFKVFVPRGWYNLMLALSYNQINFLALSLAVYVIAVLQNLILSLQSVVTCIISGMQKQFIRLLVYVLTLSAEHLLI